MSNHRTRAQTVEYSTLELAGQRYAVLSDADFRALCRRAAAEPRRAGQEPSARGEPPEFGFDAPPDRLNLAARLVARRRAAGLSQAALAARAAIRAETLNRIERGRTNPDFTTMRKLAAALRAAESPRKPQPKRPSRDDRKVSTRK